MNAERTVCVFLAVLFAVGIGAGLGSGKMLFLSWASSPRMVSRRKEPVGFWMAVAFFSVFAGLFVWTAIGG